MIESILQSLALQMAAVVGVATLLTAGPFLVGKLVRWVVRAVRGHA